MQSRRISDRLIEIYGNVPFAKRNLLFKYRMISHEWLHDDDKSPISQYVFFQTPTLTYTLGSNLMEMHCSSKIIAARWSW